MKQESNLVIDIGNTSVKYAVFRRGKLVNQNSCSLRDLQRSINKLILEYNPSRSIISSVVQFNDLKLSAFLLKKTGKHALILDYKTPLPFRNKYQTPKTLGNDRRGNAAGAMKYFPKKNCLVVDAGTCLKFDFINDKGVYQGGAISPGLKMRFEALHNFTSQLPLYKPGKTKRLVGRTTEESIYSGVYFGMLEEIRGVISEYRYKNNGLKVILTGGDSGFFAGELKNGIFADRFLTLKGLNAILEYNG